jgi:hypothetical protein
LQQHLDELSACAALFGGISTLRCVPSGRHASAQPFRARPPRKSRLPDQQRHRRREATVAVSPVHVQSSRPTAPGVAAARAVLRRVARVVVDDIAEHCRAPGGLGSIRPSVRVVGSRLRRDARKPPFVDDC